MRLLDHLLAFGSFLSDSLFWPTTFLFICLLAARWLWKHDASWPATKGVIGTLVGWMAVSFAYVAARDANVWGAPSALLGLVTFPLRILSSNLDHILWGWATEVGRAMFAISRWFSGFRVAPWPFGEAVAALPLMALCGRLRPTRGRRRATPGW